MNNSLLHKAQQVLAVGKTITIVETHLTIIINKRILMIYSITQLLNYSTPLKRPRKNGFNHSN